MMNRPTTVSRLFSNPRTWLLSLVLAAISGLLASWGDQFPNGYTAGTGDHNVLSPLGLQWADPTKFAGDWFIREAPQPHWFFDIVTFLGAKLGSVEIAYLAYWICGLVAFGFATALLAKHWAPNNQWLAALAFTFVISETPWAVVGSGSPMIVQALPAVTGGQALYLMLALLLIGRLRWVAALAPVVAILHVQQGAVVVVILAAAILAVSVVSKRFPWPLAYGLAGSVVFVVFGLWLRPVASNLADFVRACDTIIPYHCDADSWTPHTLAAYTGFIVLAGLSVVLVSRVNRTLWFASVGLAGLGLIAGMYADRLNVPVIGFLAQATNVYRLGALLLPFAVWGILAPFLRLRWSKRSSLILGVWALALFAYLAQDGWPTRNSQVGRQWVLAGVLVVIAIAATVLSRRRPFANLMGRLSVISVGGTFLVAAVLAGWVTPRVLDPTFIPDDYLRDWGIRAEKVIDPGSEVLVSPLSTGFRLAFSRGVVVDCKNVPYGGIAWKTWKTRIDAMGGPDQCTHPELSPFRSFSAGKLVRLAKEFGADYMALEVQVAQPRLQDFRALGWTAVLPAKDPGDPEDLVVLAKTD